MFSYMKQSRYRIPFALFIGYHDNQYDRYDKNEKWTRLPYGAWPGKRVYRSDSRIRVAARSGGSAAGAGRSAAERPHRTPIAGVARRGAANRTARDTAGRTGRITVAVSL